MGAAVQCTFSLQLLSTFVKIKISFANLFNSVESNKDERQKKWKIITRIPSRREIARSGLSALNVRSERNTDRFLSSKTTANEI